ncbi:MAG TPA: ABC transporter permease [Actinomycetota bacterium]|nr:ABC transporter permease [Actinomycetota bacterium]
MLKVTLRSIWDHKRRLVLTIISIVLGVSFMAGTFVLNDSFNRLFDDLFATGNEKIDTQVRGEKLFTSSFGGGDQRALIPADTVATVAAVDGVRAAEPHVLAFGSGSSNRVLDADGEPIGPAQGPPTLIESWIDGSQLTPYSVAEGRGPTADGEMALNVAAAEDGDLDVGDTVTVATQFGNQEYKLVGTVLFGTAKSSAGAISAEFTLAEAQRLAGTDGQINLVVAGAEDGIDQAELTRRVQAALPDDLEALTGERAAEELSSDVQEGFQFFSILISVFGVIALLVGIFVISNTFSIIVQQRTRELALLRAVGASRRQVLSAVIIEGVVVGLVGALIGLGVGILLAQGFISAIGEDFASGVTLTVPTVIRALLIGLVVTLLAAVLPAIRATRVPPLAALRDVAIDRSGASKVRIGFGLAIGLLAAYLLSLGWTGDGTSKVQPPVFMGAGLLVLAAIIVGPVLAGPSVRFAGRGVSSASGITGKLAVENAARSPKRTSATASALLIGVTLVALLLVFAESAKASIDKEISRGFSGDFVVMGEGGPFAGLGGFSPSITDAVADVPGVDKVMAQTFAQAELTYDDGETVQQFLTSIDTQNLEGVLEPRMDEGDIADLNDAGILVDVELADSHDVQIGDAIHLLLAGGKELDLTVQGITDDEQVLGYFTITRDTYRANVPEPLDAFVYGTIDDGADLDAVLADIDEITSRTPDLTVEDREGFIGSIAEQITFIVNFISIMLLLSIIIALIGVANTLSLSISERVRELGLLRAVGMDRTQLKRSIRWEAVIMSVLGTAIGITLAIVIGRSMMKALEPSGLTAFEVPVMSLFLLLIGGALVGTVAAVFPARRAARFPVLDAIGTE